MTRLVLAIGLVGVWFGLTTQPCQGAEHVNVVLILADDLGWTDLGCYGSAFYQTPHIDRLAAEGVRFTQHYSACTVCSPTRAALLTGKYPARLHITDWIPGQPPENPKLLVPDWTKYLPHSETTLAEVFHAAGYATASIGKWHLGTEPYYPTTHGFDINIAGTDRPQVKSFFAPWNLATLTPDGNKGDYITDRLAEEAVQFLEAHRDRPFFLYLPHFAVHTPIEGKADLVKKHQSRRREGHPQNNAAYAAMLESLDDAVGRVTKSLFDLKIAGRTVVVFTSDNGGRVPTTSNLPLRVGKGSCYEGGTRVPLIVHWPGVTKPRVDDTPVITMDLFPTLLEIAGLTAPQEHRPDGLSLVPILRGTGTIERDALFWHYPHYQHYQLGGTTPYSAIRLGDDKLIEFHADRKVELYNLREDLGEQRDRAAERPEKVQELRSRLHAWRKDVGAQMPTPNPQHDPSRPEHTPPAAKKKPAS